MQEVTNSGQVKYNLNSAVDSDYQRNHEEWTGATLEQGLDRQNRYRSAVQGHIQGAQVTLMGSEVWGTQLNAMRMNVCATSAGSPRSKPNSKVKPNCSFSAEYSLAVPVATPTVPNAFVTYCPIVAQG